MGRRKKIPTPPKSIRKYFQTQTDWSAIFNELKALALGGREVMNYNGQKIISQPNMEALKLLMLYGRGRQGEAKPDDNTPEVIEEMKEYANFLQVLNTPKKVVNPDGTLIDLDAKVDKNEETENNNDTLN